MALARLATTYRMLRHGLPMARTRPNQPLSVADIIERNAARRPDHPFVLFEDRRVTYGEYNANANRVAHWALDAGLKPKDTVALLMHNRPEFLDTWAGLAKVGVTVALINTNLAGHALAHAIEAAGTRVLISGSECLDAVASMGSDCPKGLRVWVVRDKAAGAVDLPEGADDLDEAASAHPSHNPDKSIRRDIKAGDELFYIYTSGTTGLPKAARFSHYRFLGSGLLSRIAGLGPNDVLYCALPLYHSAGGGMCVAATLHAGSTLALRRRFSASQFWDDVARFDATAFQYIGEFCRYLLNQPPSDKETSHRLRFAIGNGLRPDIWEEFRGRFRIPTIAEFYGATEGNVAMYNVDNKVGSVGKKPPRLLVDSRLIRYDVETDAYEKDANGFCIECKPDEIGELVGRIPTDKNDTRGRFEGYTSKDATEKKILHDVFEEGDAWFRTGDLLKVDAAGYYYFVDRIGDTFRWKGENVSTQEVAEAVNAYEGVEMTTVYGVEVPGADGRAGMAAIVLPKRDAFDGAAFYRYVAESLPVYAAPAFLRLQDEPEVTGTFKLRKVDLQKEGFDPTAVPEPLMVRDDPARAYVPLTPERHAQVLSGELRL